MSRFLPLTVTHIEKTIRDAVVVTLQPQDMAAFAFVQGQYLTFRRFFDGEELRRSYSICSGVDDGTLRVGIKRVDGGTFSSWANSALGVGDTIDAMPPMGNFHTPLEPAKAKSYLCFAGGSGITPVLSILRTVLQNEPLSRITLVYANRAVTTIMFREELEDLKNRFMGRLAILHVLEQDAQEIDLFTGRVDAAKCDRLFDRWIDIASVDTAFICGPEPMMLAISGALQAHGMSSDQIRFELFASGQQGRAKRPAASLAATATGPATTATVTLNGASRRIDIPKDTSLLEAALQNNLDAPYACKAGVCSTCKCKVTSGKVEMMANHALEDGEVARGYVLSCQSYPISDNVTYDYDQSGH